MYTFTKYDVFGNIAQRTEYSETIPAPDLQEYLNLDEQLDAEEWDLRDSTDSMESLKDRDDFRYA